MNIKRKEKTKSKIPSTETEEIQKKEQQNQHNCLFFKSNLLLFFIDALRNKHKNTTTNES